VKLLFDTNVILDVLLDRTPHAQGSSRAMGIVEVGQATGYLGATTITTIHYLASKAVGAELAFKSIEQLLAIMEIAAVNRSVLEDALGLGFSGYEDAVLHEAARHAGVDAIVTRDPRGFSKASLPVLSPTELLAILEAKENGDQERI